MGRLNAKMVRLFIIWFCFIVLNLPSFCHVHLHWIYCHNCKRNVELNKLVHTRIHILDHYGGVICSRSVIYGVYWKYRMFCSIFVIFKVVVAVILIFLRACSIFWELTSWESRLFLLGYVALTTFIIACLIYYILKYVLSVIG